MTKTEKGQLPSRPSAYEPMTNWDPAEAAKKLNVLYLESLSSAEETIQWYLRYRKKNGKYAKSIRLTSIILFVISTLIPLITAWWKYDALLYLGYVLASIGGGLLLIDRYYGLSSSWIRFVLTGKDLESLRNSFIKNYQLSYIQNSPLDKEGFCNIINMILLFQNGFNETVKAETALWAREFEQNMKDLIFALKAQGEKLNEELHRNNIERSEERTDLVNSSPTPEVITEAYEKNYEKWVTEFNVEGIGFGQKMTNNSFQPIDCLVFFPITKKQSRDSIFRPIPEKIRFKSINGKVYDIPTDVQALGTEIIAGSANSACDNEKVKRPGCSISRTETKHTGTIGLKVYGQERSYLLSCYHVLCSPEFELGIEEFNIENSAGGIDIVSPGRTDSDNGTPIAKVYKGIINGELDCAIATLNDDGVMKRSICTMEVSPNLPREIGPNEAKTQLKVVSVGRTTGLTKGRIILSSGKFNIKYSFGKRKIEKTIGGLIVSTQFSQSGDSGAAVLDDDNNVIGIIIATSTDLTYILPIYRILSKFSVNLKPD